MPDDVLSNICPKCWGPIKELDIDLFNDARVSYWVSHNLRNPQQFKFLTWGHPWDWRDAHVYYTFCCGHPEQ